MPTLVYRKRGRPNAFVFGAQDSPISIGRNTHSVIVVDSAGVSRHHAEIATTDDGMTWHVIDRGSANGTFVNGERVDRATLNDKDVVACGEFLLEFRRGPGTGRVGMSTVDVPVARRPAASDLPVIESLRVAESSGGGEASQTGGHTVNLHLEQDVSPLLLRIAALESRNKELEDEVLLLRESLAGFRQRKELAAHEVELSFDATPTVRARMPVMGDVPESLGQKLDRLSPRLAGVVASVMDLDRQRNAVIERLLGILVQEHDATDED